MPVASCPCHRGWCKATLSVVNGMQHVFPFLAGRAPEANEEISRIAAWYKRYKVSFHSSPLTVWLCTNLDFMGSYSPAYLLNPHVY